MNKLHSEGSANIAGPPGDLYVCDPEEHKGAEETMTTILWAPHKS